MGQADITELLTKNKGKRYTIKEIAAELKISPSTAANSMARCVGCGAVKITTIPINYYFIGSANYYKRIDKGGKVDKHGQKNRRADRFGKGEGPLYSRIQRTKGDS